MSFGTPRLGLEGATVVVPLTVRCQPGYNLAFGDVSVAQANGPRLAQGFGFFENDFPGVPCTGNGQRVTVTVFNSSPWIFREGRAAVTAEVFVFNPETGELVSRSFGPEATRIEEADSRSNATAEEAEPSPRTPDPAWAKQ